MLDQAVKCLLTPVLAASNNEQFFQIVRLSNTVAELKNVAYKKKRVAR